MSTMTISLDELATVTGGNDAAVGRARRHAIVKYAFQGGPSASLAKLACRRAFDNDVSPGALERYNQCVGFDGQRAGGLAPLAGAPEYLKAMQDSDKLR